MDAEKVLAEILVLQIAIATLVKIIGNAPAFVAALDQNIKKTRESGLATSATDAFLDELHVAFARIQALVEA